MAYHLIRQRYDKPGWDDRTASHHKTVYAAQGRFIRDYRKLQAQANAYYWLLVDDVGTSLDQHLIHVFVDYFGSEVDAPVLSSVAERVKKEREQSSDDV